MRGKAIIRGPQGPAGPEGPRGNGGTYVAQLVIDAGGNMIAPGVKGDLYFPFACEITGWTILANEPGSIEFDLWTDAYGNYPPTDIDSIVGANPPTLAAALKAQGNPTGWTDVQVEAGNTLRVNVTSATSLTRCTLALTVSR